MATINGTSGADTLTGTADADIIKGLGGNDTLTGGGGNDTLEGGTGVDQLDGGAGNDLLVIGDPNNLITGETYVGGSGFDTLKISGSISLVGFNLSSDIEKIESDADVSMTAAQANGLTTASIFQLFIETAGTVDFQGASLDLAYVYLNGSGTTFDATGASNTQSLQIIGSSGADVIRGANASNGINGGDGADTIYGGSVGDFLTGGMGADNMHGGGGDDYFGVPLVHASAGESYFGDAGYDIVEFLDAGVVNLSLFNFSGVEEISADDPIDFLIDADLLAQVVLSGTVQSLTINGAGVAIMAGRTLPVSTIAISVGGVTLDLTGALGGPFTVTGSSGADVVTGSAGADTLSGQGGDDTLTGGAGDDALNGGDGVDTVSYVSAASAVTVDLTAQTAQGGGGADTVQLFENVTGSGFNDILGGSSAANLLNGGGGADQMTGLDGNDTYVADNADDTTVEQAAQGTDLVQSSVTWTLGANVENLTLTGGAAINGAGNGVANTLIGNSAANVLKGGGGADALDGGGGLDTADWSDKSAALVVNLAAQTMTVGGVAEDTLVSIEGAIGGSGNDTLTGDAGANTLSGGGGDDVLKGGAGADTMDGGTGEDTADYSDRTVMVTVTLNGATSATVTVGKLAEDTVSNIENVTGGSIRDTITGDGLDNELRGGGGSDGLVGGGGNDLLDGGTGSDVMKGGAGNDVYMVDHVGDLATEAPSEGADIVYSSETWTLGGNFENLTLIGLGAVNGTGNGANNTIVGNYRANVLSGGNGDDLLQGGDGNDRLDGGAGADVMEGGLGQDTYVVSNTLDTLVELVGEGTDIIESRVAWTLADNFENLTLTGTSNVGGTGNGVANTILGNDGNNVLSGLGGNDRLEGGLGNDTLLGGDGTDIMEGGAGLDVFTGGAGADRFLFDEPDMAGLTSATADRITDFAGDRIGLTDIDANTATADVDDAFTFIGTGAFTNVAGQLRYEQVGGNTLVTGDVNGDGVADFMIRLDGLQTLTAGSFFL